MNNQKWTFRGIQLDLARQIETIEFINSFIDLISENGFNTLFLYLEDRIRTDSYPYPNDDECYTIKEMKGIVAYARERNIEVVPCVSILGHAERFLRYEPLKDLAELRDGREGRIKESHEQNFCPSNTQVYNFFTEYLQQICSIFPSQYLHLGFDEVWNIGYCPKCRKEAENFVGEQKLFLHSILEGYNICQKLNKRMMVWDDMFEYYPDILSEVPRDVIMVSWQYHKHVKTYRAHFINLEEQDRLAVYNKLGFECIVAPADRYNIPNTRTLTQYANKHSVLGGLMTCWEKSNCFLYRSLPNFVYAGQLWTGNNDKQAWQKMLKNIFDIDSEEFSIAMRNVFESSNVQIKTHALKNMLMVKSFFGLNYDLMASVNLNLYILTKFEPQVKSTMGKLVFADIINSLKMLQNFFEIKKLFFDFIEYNINDNFDNKLQNLLNSVNENKEANIKLWQKVRAPWSHLSIEKPFMDFIEYCRAMGKLIQNSTILNIRFCLPDQYGAAPCKIELRSNGKWQELTTKTFKSATDIDAIYEVSLPVSYENLDAIRFTVKGFGGQGICFAQIKDADKTFSPGKILHYSGEISNADYILNNDTKWAYMGNLDIKEAFRNQALPKKESVIEISLQESNF